MQTGLLAMVGSRDGEGARHIMREGMSQAAQLPQTARLLRQRADRDASVGQRR
ncbi:MAG: hypothetical protein HPY83_11845 [Anaerolineae bacterium]|nr:hypothetical protein [Anaerolineae bacterium]